MSIHVPQGDLARAKCQEPEDEFPTILEIVSYRGNKGRRGMRRAVQITADQFFGRGRFSGAPMTPHELFAMVDRLRRLQR